MEHKGGRIRDHYSREEFQEMEDWLDEEWLDDEEELEIEDWRDEENWNFENSDTKETDQSALKEKRQGRKSDSESVSVGKRESVSGGTGEERPRKKRPSQQQRMGGSSSSRPARKRSRSGEKKAEQQDQKRKNADRKQKVQSAARPVKAAGRVAGKAGKTAGKAVGHGICIAMKCGCFVAMAVIVLEFWQEFWAERSTLGQIWRVAADRNYALGLYLGIAGVILLYGVVSALWLLGGKKMPDGSRLKTFDTGRGLTAFILFAILVAAAGFVIPLLPESPQILDGARLALAVADRIKTVVLGCCAVGVVLCILRKLIGR